MLLQNINSFYNILFYNILIFEKAGLKRKIKYTFSLIKITIDFKNIKKIWSDSY